MSLRWWLSHSNDKRDVVSICSIPPQYSRCLGRWPLHTFCLAGCLRVVYLVGQHRSFSRVDYPRWRCDKLQNRKIAALCLELNEIYCQLVLWKTTTARGVSYVLNSKVRMNWVIVLGSRWYPNRASHVYTTRPYIWKPGTKERPRIGKGQRIIVTHKRDRRYAPPAFRLFPAPVR